ncbi:SH3 domain-containing protein [Rhodobacterales bacterium]|nr:SH3 domain-containing protein [Rhodobacterales bacterium]
MLIRFSALIAALVVLPVAAEAGGPPIANTTANLNMRTGPGTNHPILTTIPRGGAVTIFNCTPGFRWCDAAFANTKGWVSGRYLDYQGAGFRAPVVIYEPAPPPAVVETEVVVEEPPIYERHYPGYDRGPRVAIPPFDYRSYDPGYPPRYFQQRVY